MSKDIWVIMVLVLANHVVKLETLTFCLQNLFWQYEHSAGLGIKEIGQKRQGLLSHFQLQILLYQWTWLDVTAVLTDLPTHSTEKTLNTEQWNSVQGRIHFWVTTAGASTGYSQTFSLGLIWTCVEIAHIWRPD